MFNLPEVNIVIVNTGTVRAQDCAGCIVATHEAPSRIFAPEVLALDLMTEQRQRLHNKSIQPTWPEARYENYSFVAKSLPSSRHDDNAIVRA